MVEAEWWDYDSPDEMAEAVAGDVGFIIESALDARGSAMLALPPPRPRWQSTRSWPTPR
jgi:6-phosphogluconolactonase